jgi:hypothetical protein
VRLALGPDEDAPPLTVRLDLDLQRGLAVPDVDLAPDGTPCLTLTRGLERLTVRLSVESLRALWLELTRALPALLAS